jgi:hypothetical protein
MESSSTPLELVRGRPTIKRWRIVKLDKPTNVARDPLEFSTMLKSAFTHVFKTVVKVEEHDGALWAQIDMMGLGLQKAKQSTFAVHYPHAKFVFVSCLAAQRVHPAIDVALSVGFGCVGGVHTVNCEGSEFSVLADLALYPLSQGKFGCYRLYTALLDSHALGRESEDREIETKRRRVRVQDRTEARDDHLLEQGALNAASFQKHVETEGVVLGGKLGMVEGGGSGALNRAQRGEQPKGTQNVNRVDLHIAAPLVWKQGSIPFSCAVVVCGSSVMQGLDKLSRRSATEVAEALGDASNVIRSAFEETGLPASTATSKRLGRKPKVPAPAPAAQYASVRAVKLVAV